LSWRKKTPQKRTIWSGQWLFWQSVKRETRRSLSTQIALTIIQCKTGSMKSPRCLLGIRKLESGHGRMRSFGDKIKIREAMKKVKGGGAAARTRAPPMPMTRGSKQAKVIPSWIRAVARGPLRIFTGNTSVACVFVISIHPRAAIATCAEHCAFGSCATLVVARPFKLRPRWATRSRFRQPLGRESPSSVVSGRGKSRALLSRRPAQIELCQPNSSQRTGQNPASGAPSKTT